jgi:hypothetical protein
MLHMIFDAVSVPKETNHTLFHHSSEIIFHRRHSERSVENQPERDDDADRDDDDGRHAAA